MAKPGIAEVLPNIHSLYSNKKLISKLGEQCAIIDRIYGQRVQRSINDFASRVNAQNGTKNELLIWIDANELVNLSAIPNLSEIATLLISFDLGFNNLSENYLSAIQIANDYNENASNFKSAIKWNDWGCIPILSQLNKHSQGLQYRSLAARIV